MPSQLDRRALTPHKAHGQKKTIGSLQIQTVSPVFCGISSRIWACQRDCGAGCKGETKESQKKSCIRSANVYDGHWRSEQEPTREVGNTSESEGLSYE